MEPLLSRAIGMTRISRILQQDSCFYRWYAEHDALVDNQRICGDLSETLVLIDESNTLTSC
jgi:hypothetical protein